MKQAVLRQWVKPRQAERGVTRCSAVDEVVSVAIPTAAFGYADRLDPQRMQRALEAVLLDYGVFAGRYARRGSDLWIEHGAGLWFETTERPETVAELASELRVKHSAILCPRLSAQAAIRGKGALAAVRLTQARDGSVLGVTWTHGLGDLASLLLLIRAWSLAYRGEPHPKPAEISDRAAYLDTQLPQAARSDNRARVLSWPEFARELVHQARMGRSARRVAIDFSWNQIEALHGAARRKRSVTASDALCAHILATLRRCGLELSSEITVAVDFRNTFGIPPTALGNFSQLLFTPVAPNAELSDTAAAIRASIEAFRSGESAGTMCHRSVAKLRAAHPHVRDLMRFWFFGQPGRSNLRLSNTARALYDDLTFGSAPPSFVHARATDFPLVGTGALFPSARGAGLTLDIVLPAKVAEQFGRAN